MYSRRKASILSDNKPFFMLIESDDNVRIAKVSLHCIYQMAISIRDREIQNPYFYKTVGGSKVYDIFMATPLMICQIEP